MASNSQPSPAVDDAVREEVKDPKGPAEEPSTSDNDVAERPVRKKLSETTIESTPQNTTADGPDTPAEEAQKDNPSRSSSRGRKRSLDGDDENEKKDGYSEQGDGSNHRRKRSRDSKTEVPETEKANDADDTAEKVSSPKKKRSRDQVDKDETKGEGVAEKPEGEDSSGNGLSSDKPTEGEPDKKRHRDDSRERDVAADSKASVTSAFSNTSAVSPFGALGPSKPASKEEPSKGVSTSASAFASSSLSSFAGSEKSPFGAIGSSSTSVFKKPAESAESEKQPTKGFASAEGSSPFAATGSSGFGALGSGFGGFAAAGKPGGLTSFASPGGPSVFDSSSKAKPFGAPEEEDGEKEESAAESGPREFEQDKTDERFYAREIETGEEEEKTYFSSKAKLFQFSDREWRERGIGTFKVNLKASARGEEKIPPRLIMRADGVLRVMLNTPIFKGMTVGDASGNEPRSKQIHLASLENDRSVPILLRMPNEDLAKELYHCVRGFLEEL